MTHPGLIKASLRLEAPDLADDLLDEIAALAFLFPRKP
jgi:hypothetical protein